MFILIKKELPFLQGGSFLSNQSHVKNKVSTEVRQKAPRETALSKHFEQRFEINLPCARKTLPQSSISNANCVQAQPGDSIKKEGPKNGTFFFWRRRGDSLRYPSPKNSPPDCFSRRNCVSPVGSFESPLLQFDKKKKVPKRDLLFLAEKGGLEPPRQFLDRPTPLAGAPRHQLEYFSRLVSGLRLYSLLETAVLNSFSFLCR